jgi:twitching motility protein PilU
MDQSFAGDDRDLGPFLALMVEQGASDLFLEAGAPPTLKCQGVFRPVAGGVLDSERIKSLAYSVMREAQIREFESQLECDLALHIDKLGRFRINVHVQRGYVGLVARHITSNIPTLESLHLPPVLKQLAMLKRGLVLTVGAAGSGKSTTLAAMIDHRNANVSGHILTIEDPIEFVHSHQQSLVTQREVGLDTHSFDEALRRAMREAPDVIMIGEIRDRQTMQHALAYAETGHLCVSTMHANNANQAIQRILNFFPEDAHRQVLMDLSLNLKGVVGQRLIRGVQGKLVPAVEVMLLTPYVSELIQKGQVDELKPTMAKGVELGMCTFDQSLYELYARGDISMERALEHADSRTDLSLRIRLSSGHRPDTAGLGLRQG